MSRRAKALLVAITVVTFAVSMTVHLMFTEVGRAAARDGMIAAMNGRIRGTADIEEVVRLDFDGVEMRNFQVTSPSGTVVIQADSMIAEIAWLDIFDTGHFTLTPAWLDHGTMRITRGPNDQIDLVYAMEVPDDRVMPTIDIRGIRLSDMTMVFDLPGAPAVEMRNVSGLTTMSLGHTFMSRMDRIRGYVNIPVVHLGFEHLTGRITSDHEVPLMVAMVLDLEVAEPGMRIRYVAPGAVGRDGDAGMNIDLNVHIETAEEDDCPGGERTCETGDDDDEEEEDDDEEPRHADAR